MPDGLKRKCTVFWTSSRIIKHIKDGIQTKLWELEAYCDIFVSYFLEGRKKGNVYRQKSYKHTNYRYL